jgi:hypothetical protein
VDKTNKLLASLNYFSVFFAPFLLPIAIYFIVDQRDIKDHAKKAVISHIIPFISLVGVIIFLFFSAGANPSQEGMLFATLFGFLFVGLINIIVVIWNIVKGIKILIKE